VPGVPNGAGGGGFATITIRSSVADALLDDPLLLLP
jgi:hypothetical protein